MTRDTVFGRSERGIALAFVLACACLGGFAARESVRSAEQARFDDITGAALHGVDATVVEMRSAMRSMLGAHYVSDEFAGFDVEAFAARLREYSPFVTRLGLFAAIDGERRDDYEALMRDAVPAFTIKDWPSADGAAPAAVRERHLPVNLIDSVQARIRRMLGTDLASLDGVEGSFDRAIKSGEAMVAAVPESWPLSGTALLLHPVYAAATAPESEQDRLASFVGGIWILVDLAQPFADAMASLPRAWLSLDLSQTGDRARRLLSRTPLGEERFGLLLGESFIERRWMLGDSEIALRIGQRLDANARQFAGVLLLAALSALLALAAVAGVYQRRVVLRERVSGRRALEAERDKVARTLEAIGDAVIAVDSGGDMLYLNPSALKRFGLRGSCRGEPIDEVLRLVARDDASHAPVRFTDLSARLSALADDEHVSIDVHAPLSRAGERPQSLAFSRMDRGGDADEPPDYLYVLQDVGAEHELTRELEHRAHHDALTGCYNRSYFERRLRELIDDIAVSERCHALCHIDVDQFSIVNDTCGHAAGDRLLCELAEGLRSRLRNADVLARLGGDAFGVIISDAPPEAARRVGEKLLDHFRNARFEHDGKVFEVRASIGLVEIGAGDRDLTRIMKAADIACSSAKEGGRDALVVYGDDDAVMNRRAQELNWLPILERALAEDRFRLLYQPIARVDDGTIAHHELLLRLIGDDGEEIAPSRFIRAAERYDLMRAIDRWVIEHGLREIAAAARHRGAGTSYSLNLCGQSAADPRLLGFIEDTFASLKLDPTLVWFEISEADAITHFSTAVALIEGLHRLGARVALDDFGSGLSSFACLRDLPVDVLKIDGEFVRDLAGSPVARAMVRAIVHVALSMKLETVAECVESAEILEELKALGIDRAQGWHVGKPVPTLGDAGVARRGQRGGHRDDDRAAA